ncbi:MAG: hypothetical protein KGL62_17220, partial [Bradyrhizobium sp.]|nr:hypothetical protein [Bradyrhizobium sp.]
MVDEGSKQKSEEELNEAAETPASSPDSGRLRRAPPTIRLTATEIFNETRNTGDAEPEAAREQTLGGGATSAESRFATEPESSDESTSGKSNPDKSAPEQTTTEQSPAGRYAPEKPKAAISPWV